MKIPFLKSFAPKEIIAIDWGSAYFKCMRLTGQKSGSLKLSLLESFESNIPEEQLVTQLKDFVTKHHLLGMACACSFQDEHLHIRRMELPQMPEEDLLEAIRWQLRNIAEGSLEQYSIRYSILDEITHEAGKRLILLGFAIKEDTVQKKTKLLSQSGLVPFFMEPVAVSVAAAIDRLYPTQSKEWVIGIDIGHNHTLFFVLGGGNLYFVRPLLGCAIVQAQELKDSYAATLAIETQHAIDAFSIVYKAEQIQKIVLTGGGATLPGVVEYLSKNLGIPTEVCNPLKDIQNLDNFRLSTSQPGMYAATMGLSILNQ